MNIYQRYLFTLCLSLGIINLILLVSRYRDLQGYFLVNALGYFLINLLFSNEDTRLRKVLNIVGSIIFIAFLVVVAITVFKALNQQ